MRSARSSRARTSDEHGKKTRVDVRERILCEATRLFGERGFGGVALRDIAKACDIPLSTLSSHFARKRNLQEMVFQRAVEIIVKRDLTSRLTIGSSKQRFRRYLTNVVDFFLSDLPEMKLLDKEFQELDKPSTFDRLVRTSRGPTSMDSLMLVADLAGTRNPTSSGRYPQLSSCKWYLPPFMGL